MPKLSTSLTDSDNYSFRSSSSTSSSSSDSSSSDSSSSDSSGSDSSSEYELVFRKGIRVYDPSPKINGLARKSKLVSKKSRNKLKKKIQKREIIIQKMLDKISKIRPEAKQASSEYWKERGKLRSDRDDEKLYGLGKKHKKLENEMEDLVKKCGDEQQELAWIYQKRKRFNKWMKGNPGWIKMDTTKGVSLKPPMGWDSDKW